MNIDTVDIIGFAGAAFVLFGFYRVHIGQWGDGSLLYELDNLLGAGLLTYYALQNQSYPTLALNVVYVLVAVRGLESLATRRKKAPSRRKK